MGERDSVVFYRSFYEAVKELPAEDFKRSVCAILDYGLHGVEPQTNGIERTIYLLTRPQIDANNKRYENGKRGGRKPNNNQNVTKPEPISNQMKTKTEPNNNQNETKPEPNVNVKVKDKVKDKEKINTLCMADAEALFEQLWKIYPRKRGKGQVSPANKRRLLDIGYEQMERAINRYKADLERETWRKPQNGSTFFNSGYVDYLDDNYAGPIPKPLERQTGNAFGKFQQNSYDFGAIEAELEAELLGQGGGQIADN